MSSNYRPDDLRTTMPSGRITGLRTAARTLAPEAFDPGQVVDEVLYRGVVWSPGPEYGKGRDSRWVVCEDGIVRLALLDKAPVKDGGGLSFHRWAPAGFDYSPSIVRPFSVAGWDGAPAPAEQPSIFDLALAA